MLPTNQGPDHEGRGWKIVFIIDDHHFGVYVQWWCITITVIPMKDKPQSQCNEQTTYLQYNGQTAHNNAMSKPHIKHLFCTWVVRLFTVVVISWYINIIGCCLLKTLCLQERFIEWLTLIYGVTNIYLWVFIWNTNWRNLTC